MMKNKKIDWKNLIDRIKNEKDALRLNQLWCKAMKSGENAEFIKFCKQIIQQAGHRNIDWAISYLGSHVPDLKFELIKKFGGSESAKILISLALLCESNEDQLKYANMAKRTVDPYDHETNETIEYILYNI